MKPIYGLYATPEEAQQAVDNLRSAGYSLRDITILSSEPMAEYEFGKKDSKTWMPKIAVLGAATGCISAFLLTYITERSWAINTGGMPIVTNFANLIVIFEITMMGAIFSTVGTLLVTARLPGRGGKIYDPEISNGKILIGIAKPRDEAAADAALGGNTKRIG